MNEASFGTWSSNKQSNWLHILILRVLLNQSSAFLSSESLLCLLSGFCGCTTGQEGMPGGSESSFSLDAIKKQTEVFLKFVVSLLYTVLSF